MNQPKNSLLSERGEKVSWTITSQRIWYFILFLISILFGFLLLTIPRPEMVVALAIALIIGLGFFFHPYLGVLIYIILSYLRFEETIPALGSLHLAKLLTLTLILAWVMRTVVTKSKLYLQENGLLLLYLFCLTVTLSVPLSFWPTQSFNTLVDMLKTLAFVILFIHLLDTQKKMKNFFLVFLVANAFLAFTAVKNFIVLGQSAVSARLGGSGGFLGDANDFAIALNVALPFAFYLFLSEKKKGLKVFYFLLFIFLTLGIISTASRGGFVSLVFVFFYFILNSKRKLIGIFSTLLIFILIFFFAPPEYWQRQMTIASYQQDASAMGRVNSWKAGIRMFVDRPLLGVGAGNYATSYGGKYGGPWLEAHNAYVQVCVELGFFGILLYLSLIFYIYRQASLVSKLSSEESYLKYVCLGLKGALLAYAVGSFFLSVGYYFHLYLLLGIAILVKVLKGQEGTKTPIDKEDTLEAKEPEVDKSL